MINIYINVISIHDLQHFQNKFDIYMELYIIRYSSRIRMLKIYKKDKLIYFTFSINLENDRSILKI